MLAVEYSANTQVATVIASTLQRMASRAWRSVMLGRKCLTMFSVRVTDGASRAPEAEDMIAESRAPKNMIWANSGVRSRIRCGRICCESSASQCLTISGSIIEPA
ncbi:hypothetical protein D3C78_1502980 [compost metagenome]